MTETKHVYTAICEVMSKLATEGIAKSNQNAQQGYRFRGIDDVYNALSPMLSAAQLLILPEVFEREQVERKTKTDSAIFYTTVKVRYTFTSALDGSQHVITTFGEAMDSGDKSTNKAMSAAYKYACMQAFCIPTEGDNDADATTHKDLAPAAPPAPAVFQPKPDPGVAAAIEKAPDLETLRVMWKDWTVDQRKVYDAAITKRKNQLAARSAAEV